MSSKPIVAITMGDPAGIGPEVVLKALSHGDVRRTCYPLILGDWGVLQRVRSERRGLPKLHHWEPHQPLLPLLRSGDAIVVCALSSLQVKESQPGAPTKAGGQAAYRYIHVAAKLVLSQVADAIATDRR